MAYLPGQSTFEMQITSGKFDADLFVMTNATKFQENSTYERYATEHLTPDGSNKIALAEAAIANSVSIAGLEEMTGSTPTTGYFVTAVGSTGKTEITFYSGDIPANTAVTVSYRYTDTAEEANIDNRSSAIGEAVLVNITRLYGENRIEKSI